MDFNELGTVANAKEYNVCPRRSFKATVWKNGRLGFTKNASEELGLAEGKSVLIAVSGSDWYVKVVDGDARSFLLKKTSGYFSVDTRGLFDSLKVNYGDEEHTIIYDISYYGVDESDGLKIWFFKRRINDVRHAGLDTDSQSEGINENVAEDPNGIS